MSPVAGTQRCGLSTSSARDTVTTEHQHAVPPPHPQPLPLPLPCCCRRQPPPPPAALMPSQAACVRAAVDGVPALLQPLEAHRSILTGSLRGALASRPRRWSPASPQHVPRQARGARPHVARPAARVACVLLSATFIGYRVCKPTNKNLLCRKRRDTVQILDCPGLDSPPPCGGPQSTRVLYGTLEAEQPHPRLAVTGS